MYLDLHYHSLKAKLEAGRENFKAVSSVRTSLWSPSGLLAVRTPLLAELRPPGRGLITRTGPRMRVTSTPSGIYDTSAEDKHINLQTILLRIAPGNLQPRIGMMKSPKLKTQGKKINK